MVFKKLLKKLKEAAIERNIGKNSENNNPEYSNRFLKFYHNNKGRLLKERKSSYYEKKKNGICVRCNKPVIEGIIFCEYHQQKQVGYNKEAREK